MGEDTPEQDEDARRDEVLRRMLTTPKKASVKQPKPEPSPGSTKEPARDD